MSICVPPIHLKILSKIIVKESKYFKFKSTSNNADADPVWHLQMSAVVDKNWK